MRAVIAHRAIPVRARGRGVSNERLCTRRAGPDAQTPYSNHPAGRASGPCTPGATGAHRVAGAGGSGQGGCTTAGIATGRQDFGSGRVEHRGGNLDTCAACLLVTGLGHRQNQDRSTGQAMGGRDLTEANACLPDLSPRDRSCRRHTGHPPFYKVDTDRNHRQGLRDCHKRVFRGF